MKSSQNIISSIKNQTSFKRLKEYSQLDKLKLFLPIGMRKAILYVTYKNHRILFAFNNPGICAEFNHYSRNEIKESLKKHPDLFPSIPLNADILGFVQHNFLSTDDKNTSNNADIFYNEHSNGVFANLSKNEHLHEKFESIRKIILKNLEENI